MCINPSHVWMLRGPHHEKVPVPCKRCWSCRRNRMNDYIGRCLCEAAYSDAVICVTLTYAPRDDGADKVLHPEHFQRFIRAVRKRGHNVRYLAVGEYGTLRGRAHFHAILFFKGAAPEWPNNQNFHHATWPHGHMFADGSADERAIRYVCKYLLKDTEKENDHTEHKDYWLTMSKKPPLGAEFFAEKAAQARALGVVPSKFTYLPPGGRADRSYYMTGATRRDYLNAISTDAAVFSKSNEWVRKSFDKHAKQRAIANARYEDLEEFMVLFKAELDKRRIPRHVLVKSYLDLWCRIDLSSDGGVTEPRVKKEEFLEWLVALDAGQSGWNPEG